MQKNSINLGVSPAITYLNFACVLTTILLGLCLLLVPTSGMRFGESFWSGPILFGVAVVLAPAGLICMTLAIVSKARRFKSAVYSCEFGFFLGVTLALAWSAFVGHRQDWLPLLLLSCYTAWRGDRLYRSLQE